MQETTAGSEHGRRIPVRGVEGCKCCDEMSKGFLCACCVCMQSLSCTRRACAEPCLLQGVERDVHKPSATYYGLCGNWEQLEQANVRWLVFSLRVRNKCRSDLGGKLLFHVQ